MKTEDLLLLGAAGIALYFFLTKGGSLIPDGGGGGGGSSNYEIPGAKNYDAGDGNYFTPGGVGVYGGGYVAPTSTRNAVVQALQSGATVYGHKMGLSGVGGSRRVSWIAEPTSGKLMASLATTAQQYQIAPRVYHGKKVM